MSSKEVRLVQSSAWRAVEDPSPLSIRERGRS